MAAEATYDANACGGGPERAHRERTRDLPKRLTSTMPPTTSVPATDHATLHEALAARALDPTEPEERQRAVAGLLTLAGDRTEPLERVRAHFQRRLAERSDDFDATHALRLVEGALVQAKRPDGPWAEEARRRY